MSWFAEMLNQKQRKKSEVRSKTLASQTASAFLDESNLLLSTAELKAIFETNAAQMSFSGQVPVFEEKTIAASAVLLSTTEMFLELYFLLKRGAVTGAKKS